MIHKKYSFSPTVADKHDCFDKGPGEQNRVDRVLVGARPSPVIRPLPRHSKTRMLPNNV